MDAPDLAPQPHLEALRGLRRINEASGAAAAMLRPVLAAAEARRLQQLDLLDVACGSGDVPIAVARAAAARGLPIRLVLLDQSPTALAAAQQQAAQEGLQVATRCASALSGPLPPADVVTCSLFLHHLDRPEVVTLLKHMAAAARHVVVVADLRRSVLGWVVACFGSRVLSRSSIVHVDAGLSVHAAWTPRELLAMAAEAGLQHPRVRRLWPWRMQLIWEKEVAA